MSGGFAVDLGFHTHEFMATGPEKVTLRFKVTETTDACSLSTRMTNHILTAIYTVFTSLGGCHLLRQSFHLVILHWSLSQQAIYPTMLRHDARHRITPHFVPGQEFWPVQTVAVHLGQDNRWRVYW